MPDQRRVEVVGLEKVPGVQVEKDHGDRGVARKRPLAPSHSTIMRERERRRERERERRTETGLTERRDKRWSGVVRAG